MNVPDRHTPRQREILATLPHDLRFEFYAEEMKSISLWFDFVNHRVATAIDNLASRLAGKPLGLAKGLSTEEAYQEASARG